MGLISLEDGEYLAKVTAKAERAKLTPYAYAFHTGDVRAIKLTSIFRALTEHAYCVDALERHVTCQGKNYVRLSARR